MNYNRTSKLQATLRFAYISYDYDFLKEILLAQFQSLFGRSNCDGFLENEGKIHEGWYVKEIFFVTL